MTDALLLSRIASLEENLARVDRSLEHLRDWQVKLEQDDASEMPVSNDLWHHLNQEVRLSFRNERKDLVALRERLEAGPARGDPSALADPAAAAVTTDGWVEYARLRDETERLFEECLEFIGGLAFRRTGLDEQRMCQLADGLILACAQEAYARPWNFLTVPSLREVVTKSRMRLSRMRFPEWTLWMLPTTAYVLGHEVMEENAVSEMVSTRMEAWARSDVAERHVHVLIADIFAAYLMGPAYGHAGIRLRFDPSRAYVEDCEHPAEGSRAHVVLATLERMEACASEPVWAAQVTALRAQWSDALASAGTAGDPPDAAASLDELVEEALGHFDVTLNITAQYTDRAWKKAERLYARWRGEALGSDALDALGTVPEESPTNARDVLNAAWLMRLDRPGDAARIERAAAAMCRHVLVMRPARHGGPGQAPITAV